jgi:hypothetical protein
MNAEKFVAAIEKFFLDVIGTILPGLALLAGVWAVFGPISLGHGLSLAPPKTDTGWTLTIVVAYVLGHALTGLGEGMVVPAVAPLGKWKPLRWFTRDFGTDQDYFTHMKDDAAVLAVAEAAFGKGAKPANAKQFKGLRSTAMTFASAQEHTLHRFTFISLLNQGIATALWVIAAMLLIQRLVLAVRGAAGSGEALARAAGLAAVLLLVSLLFLERRFDFYRRTLFTPFNIAVAALREQKKVAEPKGAASAGGASHVYLAGGAASGWQNTVIVDVQGPRYLDPRNHGLSDPAAVSSWQMEAIRASGVVFANLEPAAPTQDLAIQMSYARAVGRHVILVDQQSDTVTPAAAAALKPLLALADVSFPTLAEGITYLQDRMKLA